jgi:hypothetical protein
MDKVLLKEDLYLDTTQTKIVPSTQGAYLFRKKGNYLTREEAAKYNLLNLFGEIVENPTVEEIDISEVRELSVEELIYLVDRNIATIKEARKILGFK